jgi:hypothetical protein
MPTNHIFNKEKARELYLLGEKSMMDIALYFNCSVHKVKYWLNKSNVQIRSISEAIYLKNNPNGDPFIFRMPKTKAEAILYGIGLGLYWGEGTKTNKGAIRLGNTDPELILVFINFLTTFFTIKKRNLKFALQIFSDMNPDIALDFWIKKLKVSRSQFSKTVVTVSGSIGTYKNKTKYGVMSVHYNNVKATKILQSLIPATAPSTTNKRSVI